MSINNNMIKGSKGIIIKEEITNYVFKKGAMKKKLENMHLGERINYGYRMVITMMLISGLLSIAVIGVLFFNMLNYVNKVNAAKSGG